MYTKHNIKCYLFFHRLMSDLRFCWWYNYWYNYRSYLISGLMKRRWEKTTKWIWFPNLLQFRFEIWSEWPPPPNKLIRKNLINCVDLYGSFYQIIVRNSCYFYNTDMYNKVLLLHTRAFSTNRYNNGGVLHVVIGTNGIPWNNNEVTRLSPSGSGAYHGR